MIHREQEEVKRNQDIVNREQETINRKPEMFNIEEEVDPLLNTELPDTTSCGVSYLLRTVVLLVCNLLI